MPGTIREAVAIFDDTKALDDAVYSLETHGFDRAAFSLLASEKAVSEKLGHRYQQVKDVEDEPEVPRKTFFSRVSRIRGRLSASPDPCFDRRPCACRGRIHVTRSDRGRRRGRAWRCSQPRDTCGPRIARPGAACARRVTALGERA